MTSRRREQTGNGESGSLPRLGCLSEGNDTEHDPGEAERGAQQKCRRPCNWVSIVSGEPDFRISRVSLIRSRSQTN